MGTFMDVMKRMDFGPITREELDDWYYNFTHPDYEKGDFEMRGKGFSNNALISSRLQSNLSEKDMNQFGYLVEKRGHQDVPTIETDKLTKEDQAAFKVLEAKILSGFTCHKCESASIQRCVRCKSVYYCSRECQRQDWKSHKKECKVLNEDGKASS